MSKSLFLAAFLFPVVSGFATDHNLQSLLGPQFHGASTSAPINLKRTDSVHLWNEVALYATGLDHTPVAPGENRVFGEQLGPTRASRAMAIVHIAIFDAVNAISGNFTSYTGVSAGNGPVSMDAAIDQAAHDTLAALYPSQASTFDSVLANTLGGIKNGNAKAHGITLGQNIAAAILALRTNDGSQIPEPHLGVNYFTSNQPGHWRQDPISLIPIALGAHWGQCTPFVLQSGSQFRTPPPPAMTSNDYLSAYIEAKLFGGDGIITPTIRAPGETFIATFWAYDGTPTLCAPPRLYNQITVQIADQMKLDTVDLSRLLALVNTAMADAGIAVWDSKYFYDFWRPITALRESDPGTGPSGLGDGNPATIGDPSFSPLGAPASNLNGPNFTPPFPAYPSGHAGFGGAIFEILRRFFGTDAIKFTFVSDEFDGKTKDHFGNVRPYKPQTFTSFSEAEEQNGQSRIYLGIHWHFDKTAGIAQGEQVADYVFDHAFTPVNNK